MDGTFTKDIFNLMILKVTSVDAANYAVLIAWAIIECENEDAWRGFPLLLVTVLHLLTPS